MEDGSDSESTEMDLEEIEDEESDTEWFEEPVLSADVAAASGSLAILAMYETEWNLSTMFHAVKSNQFGAVQYLHMSKCPWNEQCLYVACSKGNLRCLQYCITNACFDITSCMIQNMVIKAVAFNQLGVLKYLSHLYDPIHQHLFDASICHVACKYGSLDCLKYLIEILKLSSEQYEEETACAYGKLECLQYLFSIHPKRQFDLFNYFYLISKLKMSLECLKLVFARQTFEPSALHLLPFSALHRRQCECLQFFHETLHCELTTSMYHVCVDSVDYMSFQYLFSKGVPVTHEIVIKLTNQYGTTSMIDLLFLSYNHFEDNILQELLSFYDFFPHLIDYSSGFRKRLQSFTPTQLEKWSSVRKVIAKNEQEIDQKRCKMASILQHLLHPDILYFHLLPFM